MDNLTHNLVGALLVQMGLKRRSGLAMLRGITHVRDQRFIGSPAGGNFIIELKP